jgi:hypothetical protein
MGQTGDLVARSHQRGYRAGDDEVGSGCPTWLPLQVLRPMMQGRFAPSNERFQLRRRQSQSRAPVTICAVPELSRPVSVQADGLQFVFPGVGDRRVLRGGQHEG